FEDSEAKYLAQLPSGEARDLVSGKLYKEGQAWLAIAKRDIIPAKLRGDQRAAIASLNGEAEDHFKSHQDAAHQLSATIEKANDDMEAAAGRMIFKRLVTLYGTGLCIVVASILFAWFTGRLISQSLNATSGLINELASNNLSVPDVQVISNDEFGKAALAL